MAEDDNNDDVRTWSDYAWDYAKNIGRIGGLALAAGVLLFDLGGIRTKVYNWGASTSGWYTPTSIKREIWSIPSRDPQLGPASYVVTGTPDEIDEIKRGVLNPARVYSILKGKRISPQEMVMYFEKIDKDGNGEISPDEVSSERFNRPDRSYETLDKLVKDSYKYTKRK